MSSKGRKNGRQGGIPYREDSKTRGQHAYAVDRESPSTLSETEVRETKNHALPRDHRRHEPDSIPGYKALSAAGESRDYHGPLRGPGPLDNCLFPAGDPVEGESEGPPQRPNYEARPLSGNATTGRHGPAFEDGYGKALSLTTRRSSTESGVITQSTLVGIGPARLSQRAPPAQSSQLSPLAHSFVGLGPEIPQSAERTNLRNVSVDDQIPLGTTQSQTPVARGPNERSLYANQRGNLLQPASRRHDPDHHRSHRGPVETTEREGTQGGNKAISGRGNVPGRAGSIHRLGPNNPTKRLPTLHEHRQPGSNKPGGNERSTEKLDERYRIRPDARRFFEHGRVFAVLWPEISGNGGGNGSKRSQSEPTDRVATGNTRFGETVFSHIRRMVVVREDHGFCLCLAINTYQGQGVDKPGFSDEDKEAHSIIYIVGTTPSCNPSEQSYLGKKAIAVDRTSDDQKLDPMSRLNYKKVYTVEHNVKVMDVGRVTRESLGVLLGYWRNTIAPPPQRPI